MATVPIPARPRVLFVGRDDDNRAMYREYLAAVGFSVVETDETDRPDLADGAAAVVVDQSIRARRDGLDILRTLRRRHSTRTIPVIVLSTSILPADRQSAEHAGCSAYCVKPCLPDALAKQVRVLIAGR